MTITKPATHELDVLVPPPPTINPPFVARPRLQKRVDDLLATSQVLNVVAPAASGKTTLLVDWRRARPELAVAHLSLDLLDNDATWLWGRIVAALQTLGAPVGEVAAEPTSVDDMVALTHRLRADLAGSGTIVLVLDDLQHLHDPMAADLLDQLLLNLPSSLRVILSSRTYPPLHEGLLRSRGHLAELPARELCFDAAELADLFASFDVSLSPQEIRTLHERTEGWCGGVMLAGVSTAESSDPRAFVSTFSGSNRYVADLFQRDVLADLPPDLQDFLLVTSVLDSFDAARCNAITRDTNAATALERLERNGMFLEHVGHQPTVFRYQQLFREFLRHQLHLLDPETERCAHRSAATWYEMNDDITTASRHLIAADATEAAAQLVLRHARHYVSSGRIDVLRSCIEALPCDALIDSPHLLLKVIRLCVFIGMRDYARSCIQRSRWRLVDESNLSAYAQVAMLAAYAAGFSSNLESAIDHAYRALTVLERLDKRDAAAEANARLMLAASYTVADQVVPARRHLDASQAAANPNLFPIVDSWLKYREGELDQALQHAETVLQSTEMSWFRTDALLVRGGVRRERNELAEAETDLLAAADMATQLLRPTIQAVASMELTRLRFAQGRPRDAYDYLTTARSHVEGRLLRQRIDVLEATLWLLLGDTERALSLRQRLPDGNLTMVLDTRLALATDDVSRAAELVTELSADARTLRQQIVATLLQARVDLTRDTTAAMANLRQAITLARGQRFVRQLALDLPELDTALRQIVAEGEDPYLLSLLLATTERPSPDAVGTALAHTLSTREMIVLRYLPTPLANKEIAAELHVSVNTLKTHLKSINRKLGTGSRTEAIAVARALTLV